MDAHVRNMMRPLITIKNFPNKKNAPYPYESENTMLLPLLVLVLFTLFVGSIGIPFGQGRTHFDILSKWLTPSINFLHSNSNNSNYFDWYEFVRNAIFSVSIAFFGIFIAFLLYGPAYSYFQNFNLINFFVNVKLGPRRIFWDKIINGIYNWSCNRGYIDVFYAKTLTKGIRGLAKLTHFFDRQVVDGIPNGIGVTSFCVAEMIKYLGGGRISSYLFFYLFYVSLFLFLVI